VKETLNKSSQKQPSCKKRCGPVQNGQCKKSCEIQAGGQEIAVIRDGRLMAQIILIKIIQVNLCCLLPASLGLGTNELSLLKFMPSTYHHSIFLATSLDYATFFTLAILNRAAPYFTAWLFLCRLEVTR